MRVGYARVSTIDQSPELQLEALRRAGCEKVFTEKASGAKDDRPELARIFTDVLRAGDTLVVWKLDRLARSLKKLIATAEELEREAQEAFAAKEQALEQKLAEAERKINELQAEKDPQSAYLLSPEQQAEIDRFRAQEVETRRELRKVKRDLKADIEALGTRLELLNIALIPALIIAFGAATWLLRRRSARA